MRRRFRWTLPWLMLTMPSRMFPSSYNCLSKLRDSSAVKRASRMSSYRSKMTTSVNSVSSSALIDLTLGLVRVVEDRALGRDQPDRLSRTADGGALQEVWVCVARVPKCDRDTRRLVD